MTGKTPVFSAGPVEWIGVVREGNQFMAMVGPDLVTGLGGYTYRRLSGTWQIRWKRNTGVQQRYIPDARVSGDARRRVLGLPRALFGSNSMGKPLVRPVRLEEV